MHALERLGFGLLVSVVLMGAQTGKGPVVLESDNPVFLRLAKKATGIGDTFFLIRKGVYAKIILRQEIDERSGSDRACTTFGYFRGWTERERNEALRYRVIAVRQRKDLEDCVVNLLSGTRVVQGVEGQCDLAQTIKCTEVRALLEEAEFAPENVDIVMEAFTTRPFPRGADAGQPDPNDAGRLEESSAP